MTYLCVPGPVMIKGLHLELTDMCTLKCPGCTRTHMIENYPRSWSNHNINIDDLLNFLDIDLTGLPINICGNHGDPIYHPGFHGIVDALKQRGAYLNITTNGSYKSRQWWQTLCESLDQNDSIVFSIDGTPDNFTEYRINADWASIHQGIEVAVASKAKTIWKYIVFRYNQDSIELAETLSRDLGIDEFRISNSDRFTDDWERYKPDDQYVSMRFYKQKQSVVSVDPKCQDDQHHYISADGYYISCCYLASKRLLYKTEFGKDRSRFDIRTTTITELLSRDHVSQFYENINQNLHCQQQCPG